jgi:5-methylthioadenosine/S-adenosylhomocysteine deaminase
MPDVLVHAGAIVTVDDAFTIYDPGWLYVVDGVIAELGPGEPPAARHRSATTVIDATGMAVMPGMVNAHTHLFQTFFRGLGDDKSLLDWLRDYIWPAASLMTADEGRAAITLGLVENLRSGVTSVLDHQYVHGDPAIDHEACAAADRVGLRYLMARGWADRNYTPQLMESADTVVERITAVARRWNGHDGGRIRVENGPLIPWGCSDDAMLAAAAAAKSWGGGMHVHCGETAIEVEMSLDERGVRHVQWLHNLGLLGPDVQLAHSVWLDDDELDLVASSGATIVHCPVSNMYLASGIPRVVAMRERGINVALASDGPGSNNRQDMFEAMKASVLMQKVATLDPIVLQPEDALRMACRGGAQAFGLPEAIGALEVGRRGDFVVVNLESVFVAPVHRVPSALVFNVTPRDVRHVAVDGRLLVRDGELTTVDERSVLAEAHTAARAMFTRAGIPVRW